jgi:NADPH:quinone reductase-like Zn-dependent oxidoreductase
MEAIYIVKNGKPAIAFEQRAITLKEPENEEVLIEVEAFGINFADVVARLGLYRECPPLPAVVGYEVVGKIMKIGASVDGLEIGDRVVAFTFFGGYATHVVTNQKAVVRIDENFPAGKALALAVQYCTAYYASNIACHLFENEKVLIQAGAGGVGNALIQLCRLKNCKIYATAGSGEKVRHLENMGVHKAINYRTDDFASLIDEKLDVVFDSIGGKTFKKGLKLLNHGGRMLAFGAASQLEAGNFFSKIKFALAFGIYHPVQFIMNSRSLNGVNMLKIGMHKPEILQYCMQQVYKLALENQIDPFVGGMYPVDKLNEIHLAVENRETMGKIGIYW